MYCFRIQIFLSGRISRVFSGGWVVRHYFVVAVAFCRDVDDETMTEYKLVVVGGKNDINLMQFSDIKVYVNLKMKRICSL